MTESTAVILIVFAIWAKLPARAWRVILWIVDEYRINTMFHYVEYTFHGRHENTMRSGPLNDLEGTGLILQIKQRGGRVTMHKEGTQENIKQFIDYRQNELSERQGRTINHAKKTRV